MKPGQQEGRHFQVLLQSMTIEQKLNWLCSVILVQERDDTIRKTMVELAEAIKNA